MMFRENAERGRCVEVRVWKRRTSLRFRSGKAFSEELTETKTQKIRRDQPHKTCWKRVAIGYHIHLGAISVNFTNMHSNSVLFFRKSPGIVRIKKAPFQLQDGSYRWKEGGKESELEAEMVFSDICVFF